MVENIDKELGRGTETTYAHELKAEFNNSQDKDGIWMSFPGRGCSTKSLGRRNCHMFFDFSRIKLFAVRLAQQLQS